MSLTWPSGLAGPAGSTGLGVRCGYPWLSAAGPIHRDLPRTVVTSAARRDSDHRAALLDALPQERLEDSAIGSGQHPDPVLGIRPKLDYHLPRSKRRARLAQHDDLLSPDRKPAGIRVDDRPGIPIQ